MAEKATGKKDQQQGKNKKGKQNEKKKNQENGVKHLNKQQSVQNKNQTGQKKKDKGNKPNNKSLSKKKSGTGKSFLRVLFTRAIYISLVLGFIYIVDYEKFTRIRDGAGYILNKTVSLLPPAVVSKGRDAIEYVRPTAELTLGKINSVVNQTSTFFNTNPLVKDHWSNVKEISSIASARLVDYMRTVYLQVTGYCLDVKNKIFK